MKPQPGFHCRRCWHLWREGDERFDRLGCPYCNPDDYGSPYPAAPPDPERTTE